MLMLIAVSWIWKGFEFAAYERTWITGNLGWGYSVDITFPTILTAVVCSAWLGSGLFRFVKR